jgi:lipopolysaccharide export LptBFGC system permease protein LptF
LTVGIFATGLLFALDEFLVPQTEEIAEQLHARHNERFFKGVRLQPVEGLIFVNTISPHEQRYWVIGSYNQQTGEMTRPHLEWELPDGSKRTYDAERATYSNGTWTFSRVQAKTNAPNVLYAPKTSIQPTIVFSNFSETPEVIRSEIVINNLHHNPSNTRRADIPVRTILNYLRLHPEPDRSIRPWIYTKLHGRFAGPVACIVVVLVAIPFAAASGRRNVFVGVAASILIFFGYYVLQQLGFAFGEAGHVPAWLGAWLPNLVFAAGSLWITARAR